MANLIQEEEFWLAKFTRESEAFAHYKMLLSAVKKNSSSSPNSGSFYLRCVATARRRRNYAAKRLREVQKENKNQKGIQS